eukprot:TRINITY_DN4968_c0_g1_i10.p1 TRINITY_DN4968_c0_g1~~TRINITY_DN4968_c0_g1_i10.p1  ORF type:complete len:112 (+),score=15.06 TRINITY_DN4968_c0_g1_i10:62-397(+)
MLCMYCILMCFFFLMIRRPPRSTLSSSSAASDVYKRQGWTSRKHFIQQCTQGPPVNGRTVLYRTRLAAHFYHLSLDSHPTHRIVASGPYTCLLYTSPSPRDRTRSRMPSSA